MNIRKKFVITAIILLTAIILSGCVQNPDKAENQKTIDKNAKHQKIVIAVQPTERLDEISPRAKELETFLESRVNADIEIYIPMSYSTVVESLRFGQAQVGFMSAWPSAISSKMAGTDVVLAEIREVIIDGKKTNETFYYSYYIVMNNSSITKLEDLKGKRVVYSSLSSTSGYLFPVAKLVEKDLIAKPVQGQEADPREFFSSVIIAGGYGPAWEALKRGQADAGVIAGDVSEKLFKEIQENTRIVETMGPIPSHGIVFSKNLQEPLRSEFMKALLELNKPEYNNLMRKLVSANFVGFKETNNRDHLAGLTGALNTTGYKLTEKLG